MMKTHKAIVLNAVKYGEADLIVKCYTEIGLKSYLLKRILKSKKGGKFSASYFQPLSQLEITAKYPPNRSLYFISEANIAFPYTQIAVDIHKQTIVVFLAEILTNALKEEEVNQQLFSYLETAFKWLDTHDHTANFHLLFLMNLSKHLGFAPPTIENTRYFDLVEGKFTNHLISKHYISSPQINYFNAVLGTNFDALKTLNFNKQTRQELLEILIQYFELHLSGFRKPRSLDVLKAVFN